jgi:FkbM family methyltransferase
VSGWVSREILAGTTYPVLAFVEDVQVVFDVGANCGATTVHFLRHYPDAEIHSFEPATEPRAYLERNVQGSRNVHVHPFGLDSEDRTAALYFGDGDVGSASVHFREGVNLDSSEPVQLRAAGPWAAQHGIDRIDILKVDVEGSETAVLSSLRDLLPTVKVLYLEYDSRDARRELEALVEESHELYIGNMFLDQGECVYLRRDLADQPTGAGALGDAHAARELRDLPEEPTVAREETVRDELTTEDGDSIVFEHGGDDAGRAHDESVLLGRVHPALPFVGAVDVVVDVGAGCGAATILFARRHPGARVHALETSPPRRAHLTHNVAALVGVQVHAIGAGRAPGAWARDEDLERIDILKVDADGTEDSVLVGLAPLLAEVKVLYLEYASRGARRAQARLLSETHDLYLSIASLDRGRSVYLRRDLAALPDATEHLRELFAAGLIEAQEASTSSR